MAFTLLINLPVLARKTVPIALITIQIPPVATFCHCGSSITGSRKTALEWYIEYAKQKKAIP
jgi:hypothetical protein